MSKAVFDIKNIPNLHRLERVVLKELALFADKSNRAWPHNKTLADKTGYSVRSVQKALQSLQKIGFIDVKYTGRFIANGDFLVEKRYIDLLVQNWMPKRLMAKPLRTATSSNCRPRTSRHAASIFLGENPAFKCSCPRLHTCNGCTVYEWLHGGHALNSGGWCNFYFKKFAPP